MRGRYLGARRLIVVAWFAFIGILCMAAGFFFLASPTASLPPEGARFQIERGESAIEVARLLESSGAIRSSMLFRVMMKITARESSLKAGIYRIQPGMRADKILAMLISGQQELVKIAIPEGYTLRKTAALLADKDIVDYNAFMMAATSPSILERLDLAGPSVEGYLFPETYLIARGLTPESVIQTLVDTFKSRIAALPEVLRLSRYEIFEKLVIASIIEREYRSEEEAPLIASVFYNRLRIGMALQSCATVEYVITEKLGKPHPKRIFEGDIRIKDPYNTYTQKGLPPGPICSPGMTAIAASVMPAQTDYLYFRLLDAGEGKHVFSRNLEEHQKAGSLAVKSMAGS